jgi:hypothetical protein
MNPDQSAYGMAMMGHDIGDFCDLIWAIAFGIVAGRQSPSQSSLSQAKPAAAIARRGA